MDERLFYNCCYSFKSNIKVGSYCKKIALLLTCFPFLISYLGKNIFMQNKQKQTTLHTYFQSDKSLSCKQKHTKLSSLEK